MDFEDFLRVIDAQVTHESEFEERYGLLVENNPVGVMEAHIENLLKNPNAQSGFSSAVLLGRLVKTKPDLLASPDKAEFVQNSLVGVMCDTHKPLQTRTYVALIFATFAGLYRQKGLWNNTLERLLCLCASGDESTVVCGLECLSYCLNNGSVENVEEVLPEMMLRCLGDQRFYVYALRVVYAANAAPQYMGRILEIMGMGGDVLEPILSDFTNYFEENGYFLSNEQAASLLMVLLGVVAKPGVSDGARICGLFLISLVISRAPGAIGDRAKEFVELLLQMMCTMSRDVSKEAALTLNVASEAIGGTTIFSDACWNVATESLGNPHATVRKNVFVLLREVLPGLAILWSMTMTKELWEIIKNGFVDADGSVRIAAYGLSCEFFKTYTNVLPDMTFNVADVVPDVLSCFTREKDTHAIIKLMKVLLEMCSFLKKGLLEVAAPIFEIVGTIFSGRVVDTKLLCLAMQVARLLIYTTQQPVPAISTLCKGLLKNRADCPQTYYLETLHTLAVCPNESQETVLSVLELVFKLSCEENLSSRDAQLLNAIVKLYVHQRPECVRIAVHQTVDFVIRGLAKPFESFEVPVTTSASTLVDYIHLREKASNTVVCYNFSEVDDKCEFLATLSMLLRDLPSELGPYIPTLFETVVSLTQFDASLGMTDDLVKCCARILPHMNPPEGMLLINTVANFPFSAHSKWKTRIQCFTQMFMFARDNYPSNDLRDTAVSCAVGAIVALAQIMEDSNRIGNEIEDVREIIWSYTEIWRLVGDLMGLIFHKFGDCGNWREAIERFPTFPGSICIWGQFYREVRQDEEVFGILMRYISLRDEKGSQTPTSLEAIDVVAQMVLDGVFPKEALSLVFDAVRGSESIEATRLCISAVIRYYEATDVTPFVDMFLQQFAKVRCWNMEPVSMLHGLFIIEQHFLEQISKFSASQPLLNLIEAFLVYIQDYEEYPSLISRFRIIVSTPSWQAVHKSIPESLAKMLC